MNMLRIPKDKPRSARASRKRRKSTQVAQLELTLEMPRHRPDVAVERPEAADEPERGVAEIDFYI